MSPEAFAILVASCGLNLPPGITADRLHGIAQVESQHRLDAVSPPNSDGSRDYGILQINSQWIGKPGFPATVAELMEPCRNIAASVKILADADWQAYCAYNTGRRNCRSSTGTNGYPEKVFNALANPSRRGTQQVLAVVPRARPPPVPMTPQPFDLFERHGAEQPTDQQPADQENENGRISGEHGHQADAQQRGQSDD